MTAEKFGHHSVVIEIIKKGGDMKTAFRGINLSVGSETELVM